VCSNSWDPRLDAEVQITVLHVFTDGRLPTMLDRPVRDLDIRSREFLTRHCPSAAHIEFRLGAVAKRVSRRCQKSSVLTSWF